MAQSGELRDDPDSNKLVRYVISTQLRRKGYHLPPELESCATSQDQDIQNYQQVYETLVTLCEEFRTHFHDQLNHMSQQLKVASAGDALEARSDFMGVINELFSDGIKWSRIVAMFAFGVQLAEDCLRRENTEYVNCIVEWMTAYLTNHLQPWIKDHEGWDGLLMFTEDRRNTNSPWPGLNFFAGIAALGAIAIGAVWAAKS